MASGHWYQVFYLNVNLIIIFRFQSVGGQVSNHELKPRPNGTPKLIYLQHPFFQMSVLDWREEVCGIRLLPG